MNPAVLLNMTESETFDFKKDQYKFYDATDENRTELLKDIIAFANAWKTGDAFIVIGVSEQNGRKERVTGVTTHLKDNDIQQFVNSKTNRPVRFLVYSESVDGLDINVIRIAQIQARPIFLLRPFSRLEASKAYIRSGSSTGFATPDQIAAMAAADREMTSGQTVLALEWAHANEPRRLGTTTTITCVELLRPLDTSPSTPPQASPLDEKAAQVLETNPHSFVVPGIPFFRRPSDEDLIEDAKERVQFVGLRVWLRNLGARNVASVRVRIVIPDAGGLRCVDQCDRQRANCSDVFGLSPSPSVPYDTSISQLPGAWCIEVDAKTIQPQAEFWSLDPFFIASSTDCTVEAIATIFADDLATPIEIPLGIHVNVTKRTVTLEDLLSMNTEDVDPQ